MNKDSTMVGSVTSAGSGVDIHALARQMATAQTQPKANQLALKKGNINNEVKALNELSDSLNDFYNALDKLSKPSTFGSLKVNITEDNEKMVGVSVDNKAVANTYQLQVNQLATQSKIQAFNSDSGSNEVKAGDVGSYKFSVGDKDLTIDVAAGETLAELANKINDSDDNPGVIASIVSDGDHTYLTMTSKETGEDHEIRMEKDGSDIIMPKPGDANFDTASRKILEEAKDAEFYLDGIKLKSSDNNVDDVIKGVTLDLKESTDGKAIRFDINPDTSTMKSSGKDVVDELNTLLKTISKLTKTSIDEATGNRSRGPLASDSMVSSIRNELRGVVQKEHSGPYKSLASLGIVTDRDGELEVDSAKLKKALEEDPEEVTKVFMDSMKDFKDVATKYIGRPEASKDDDEDDEDETDDSSSGSNPYIPKEGLIDTRIKSLNEDLKGVDKNVVDVQKRFQSVYQRHLNEYVAMNEAVSKMQNSLAGLL
ncbi:hypothetical protein EOPP23_13060 [Endozoicomonas sp. OPT23]|uniref:flagellar filament capping protein FliD n=1 Tax=Endozoicomonas sp. OPT23 TaxID=2072845 RepID=UPI00129B603E|nr:flagellar filament capping protein FliD [Endozoicomonas sp. OPT23]MRI33918.1 hypothetical protein [Endozoicomonas sp. OPT23]